MYDPVEIDPERTALMLLVNVLTPLRQHRQASAERACKRLEHSLLQLCEQLLTSQASFSQERDNQKARRQQLSTAHLQQTVALSDIDRWHEKERRMLDRLAQIRQHISHLHTRIETLREQLQQALLEVKARQRAVEKLACLSESLHDE
ncbi:type III secretion system stalk subunit SctO [Pseudomonas psychrophila]|uniref:type III secretion system stalk subunit SctO n=1 Tax=Pseudomonas psychrophila TaxID=122355 RepID=UPI0002E46ED1|nr:YscO family type III secretion system apparatus protein [Pseudomonas psychrophila]